MIGCPGRKQKKSLLVLIHDFIHVNAQSMHHIHHLKKKHTKSRLYGACEAKPREAKSIYCFCSSGFCLPTLLLSVRSNNWRQLSPLLLSTLLIYHLRKIDPVVKIKSRKKHTPLNSQWKLLPCIILQMHRTKYDLVYVILLRSHHLSFFWCYRWFFDEVFSKKNSKEWLLFSKLRHNPHWDTHLMTCGYD